MPTHFTKLSSRLQRIEMKTIRAEKSIVDRCITENARAKFMRLAATVGAYRFRCLLSAATAADGDDDDGDADSVT
jgi:hypothetical protein